MLILDRDMATFAVQSHSAASFLGPADSAEQMADNMIWVLELQWGWHGEWPGQAADQKENGVKQKSYFYEFQWQDCRVIVLSHVPLRMTCMEELQHGREHNPGVGWCHSSTFYCLINKFPFTAWTKEIIRMLNSIHNWIILTAWVTTPHKHAASDHWSYIVFFCLNVMYLSWFVPSRYFFHLMSPFNCNNNLMIQNRKVTIKLVQFLPQYNTASSVNALMNKIWAQV